MKEVLVSIPEEIVFGLQSKFGYHIGIDDIVLDALTIFNWAILEKACSREILSSTKDGKDIKVLTMRSLESVITGYVTGLSPERKSSAI